MADKNIRSRVVVEHEGNTVFDSSSALPLCDNIRAIKKYIELNSNIPAGSQLLSFENILLQENLGIEDLWFRQNQNGALSSDKSKVTRQIDTGAVTKLTLATTKGQVNIKVNIISAQREPINVSLVVFGATSVFQLREMVMKNVPEEQRNLGQVQIVLSVQKKQLEDNKYLFETLYDVFNLKEDVDANLPNQRMNNASLQRANQVDKQLIQYNRSHGYHKQLAVQAMLRFRGMKSASSQSSQLSVCIDFRFNLLRNVKKVNWKNEPPWYREVHDGLNWFGYCKNEECAAFKELFVVNRGYGIFKLEQELAEFSCPICIKTHFDLSNMGFVNCEWALKGQLRTGSQVKVYADGQTYDQKLYTFEELNYKKEFNYLNIFVKRVENSSSQHVSSQKSISSISSPSNGSYNKNMIEAKKDNKSGEENKKKPLKDVKPVKGKKQQSPSQKLLAPPKLALKDNSLQVVSEQKPMLLNPPDKKSSKQNPLEEYKAVAQPKQHVGHLVASNKKIPSKRDSLVDINAVQKNIEEQQKEGFYIEERTVPEQESTSWFSWFPSIWCCSAQTGQKQNQETTFAASPTIQSIQKRRQDGYKR